MSHLTPLPVTKKIEQPTFVCNPTTSSLSTYPIVPVSVAGTQIFDNDSFSFPIPSTPTSFESYFLTQEKHAHLDSVVPPHCQYSFHILQTQALANNKNEINLHGRYCFPTQTLPSLTTPFQNRMILARGPHICIIVAVQFVVRSILGTGNYLEIWVEQLGLRSQAGDNQSWNTKLSVYLGPGS